MPNVLSKISKFSLIDLISYEINLPFFFIVHEYGAQLD